MLGNLNGWHAIILLVVILLLFGAPKLPALARSLGQSMKIFRSEVKNPDVSATDAPQGDSAGGTTASASTSAAAPSNATAKVDGTDTPSKP